MSQIKRMASHIIQENWMGGYKPDVKKMTNEYLEAAIFADSPEDYNSRFSVRQFDKATRKLAETDIKKFISKAKKKLEFALANTTLTGKRFWGQVAHDFWLTRQGHGAGFWDDPDYYGGQKNADALSKVATSFGEKYLDYDEDKDEIYMD